MRPEKRAEIAKAERRKRCFAEIDKMSFAERCQCYLDHKTAKVLKKSGFGMQPVLHVRAETTPSISKILGRPQYWIQFFLENTPKSFWGDFLIPREYEAWVQYYLMTPKNRGRLIARSGKDGWQKFVYGGNRNRILDKKWVEKPPIELRGTDTPKVPLKAVMPQGV